MRASMMKSRCCQRGIPERAAGLRARRERKNEVDMISNVQPSLRAMASARGTLGLSMKPKRSDTRVNVCPTLSMDTRSAAGTRGACSEWMVFVLVQHLVVLEAVHESGGRAVG